MKSGDLTRDQLQALDAKLIPLHDYLHRLRARMEQQGFGGDPIFSHVIKADESVSSLRLALADLLIERDVGPADKRRNPRA